MSENKENSRLSELVSSAKKNAGRKDSEDDFYDPPLVEDDVREEPVQPSGKAFDSEGVAEPGPDSANSDGSAVGIDEDDSGPAKSRFPNPANLTMKQKLIGLAVLVAAAVVVTSSPGEDVDHLPQTSVNENSPAMDEGDSFETLVVPPPSPDLITADSTAIDASDSPVAQSSMGNAEADLDDFESLSIPTRNSQAPINDFEDSFDIPSVQSEPASNASLHDFENLTLEVADLSRSVASIEETVERSVTAGEKLSAQVASLMTDLRSKNAQLEAVSGRPDIQDLVIFSPAPDCKKCVAHALFSWNGAEHEVGDGLSWQGFSASISGDQLSLANGDQTYHYWYR